MSHPIRFAVAAVCTGLFAASASSALAASDKVFLKKAMEADNSEIHMGRIAERKGSSQAMRDYGRMLQTDHGMHKTQVVQLARPMGVSPTDQMAPGSRAEERKLAKLSGQAFDHEFAGLMVMDHQKAIAMYQAEADKHNPVATMARQTLPTLHKHLNAAQRLAKG